jgi:hypothetical protein
MWFFKNEITDAHVHQIFTHNFLSYKDILCTTFTVELCLGFTISKNFTHQAIGYQRLKKSK